MGDQHRLNQIMKTLLTLLCGGLLIVGQTYAQTSSGNNRSMTKDSANTTSRSVTDNRGTVVDYSRNSILIDDGNGQAPVRFQVGDDVRVIGPDGKTMPTSAIKKNALVRLHFTQSGGHSVVDEIKMEKKM